MKKSLIILSFFFLALTLKSLGQVPVLDPAFKVYERDGDFIGEWDYEEIQITGKRPSRSKIRRGKRRLEEYTRLRWHVHKVYPYAVKVGALLEEVNEELNSLPDSISRRDYIKTKEDNLFGKYEQDIRRMTKSQGKILIKLIHRQTGTSMYSLIKDVKSGATAVFWQSVGRIFGINLRDQFEENNDDDKLIEGFVRELEEGGYNIVYKCRNYELK